MAAGMRRRDVLKALGGMVAAGTAGAIGAPRLLRAQKRFDNETLRAQFWAGPEGQTIQTHVVEPFMKKTGAKVVVTEGVTPTLYIDYKHCRIKQYHKEGRALRTETTFNDATDFKVGKRLGNLPALRAIGFSANRRLLDVQSLSHDPTLGDAGLAGLQQPVVVGSQRAAGLRLAEPRAQALLAALVVFRLLPRGFSSPELRAVLAPLLGVAPDQLTAGQMTYHLRRLRLHGLIERLPRQHRYQVTPTGWRLGLFCTRAVNRLLGPGLAQVLPQAPPLNAPLQRQLSRLEISLDRWLAQALAPV